MKESEESIKLRYSPEEYKIIKEKAEKSKKTINKYQIDISKRAKVKIEVSDEN
jgi:uncharacterized protein (DUF1778 family)